MSAFCIELLTTFKSAGGQRLGWLTKEFADGDATFDIFGDDQWQPQFVRNPRKSGLLARLCAPNVLCKTLPTGHVSEWMLRNPGQSFASPTITAGVAPARERLVLCGATRAVLGGVVTTRFSFAGTLAELFANIIAPSLALDGITDVVLGDVEPTQSIELEIDRWSPWRTWSEGCTAAHGESRFRRNGSVDWRLDCKVRIGDDKPSFRATRGRNMLDDEQLASVEPRFTEVVGYGDAVPGSTDAASLAENAWKVHSTASGWVLLRAVKTGGLNPIRIDGMFGSLNPAYLLKTDGTTQLILDSRASDSAVQVASTTGISANDIVSILKTASGERLDALRDANAAAQHGLFTQQLAVSGKRGERQYNPNGILTQWEDATVPLPAATGAIDTSHTAVGGTWKLKGFSAGFTLAKGGLLVARADYDGAAPLSSGGLAMVQLLADKVCDGAGKIALADGEVAFDGTAPGGQRVFAPTGSGPNWTNNAVVRYFAPSVCLTGYRVASETNDTARGKTWPMRVQRYARGATQLTGALASAAANGDGTASLKNMTPFARIHAGDSITKVSGAAQVVAMPTVVAADGTCTVEFLFTWQAGSSAINTAITRDGHTSLPLESPVGDALQVPILGSCSTGTVTGTGDARAGLESAAFAVKYVPALPRMWITSSWYLTGIASTFTQADSDPDYVGKLSPGVQLARSSDGLVLASARGGSFTIDVGDINALTPVTVQEPVDVSADLVARVRALFPVSSSGHDDGRTGNGVRVFFTWLSVTLSPDTEVPLVDGSNANEIWDAIQNALLAAGDAPIAFEIDMLDLMTIENKPAAFADLATHPLGADVFISTRNTTLRVMGLKFANPKDTKRVRVLVGRTPSFVLDATTR